MKRSSIFLLGLLALFAYHLWPRTMPVYHVNPVISLTSDGPYFGTKIEPIGYDCSKSFRFECDGSWCVNPKDGSLKDSAIKMKSGVIWSREQFFTKDKFVFVYYREYITNCKGW